MHNPGVRKLKEPSEYPNLRKPSFPLKLQFLKCWINRERWFDSWLIPTSREQCHLTRAKKLDEHVWITVLRSSYVILEQRTFKIALQLECQC